MSDKTQDDLTWNKLLQNDLTTEDLSALSKDELIKRIGEQDKQLQKLRQEMDEYKNPPPNDWHSWFYALLNIVLFRFRKDSVKILREVVLGVQPPRADFVIVEESDIVDLGLDVFKGFRNVNILEFKNPSDDLTEETLWKALGYAGFYIEHFHVLAKDLTLTLFRAAKPVKLIKELGEHIKEGDVPGIYEIIGWNTNFPIRIVVTTELKGEEYAGFRTITKKPDIEDIKKIIDAAAVETNPEMIKYYRMFLEMLSKLDSEVVEEAYRRIPDMAKDWRQIFKFDEEINNTTRKNLYIYVQNGTMTLENAATNAGIPVSDFEKEMADNGYKVPKRTPQPA